MKRVYWGSFEFSENKNPDRGGMFYAFAKAADPDEFLAKVNRQLGRWGFTLKTTEFIRIYSNAERWNTPAETAHFKKLYKKAYRKSIVIDTLYRYRTISEEGEEGEEDC